MGETKDVLAAGVVVFRQGKQVVLVHRPKYLDWSFPKGKLDRWEHRVTAAVREVAEETGLHVRLAAPLSSQRYRVGGPHGRLKTVSYWTGRVIGDDDVSGYVINQEIDDVGWFAWEEAMELLTYEHDRATLQEARKARRKTKVFIVLRHGLSRSRKAWRPDDRLRPLLKAGQTQAQKLVPVLAAYDVTRIVSSASMRCVQTLTPYADVTGWELESHQRLTEEDATVKGVRRVVEDLVGDDRGSVLCTHRPVLPHVFDALGLVDPKLDVGEMLVAHLREGRVTTTERHLVR